MGNLITLLLNGVKCVKNDFYISAKRNMKECITE